MRLTFSDFLEAQDYEHYSNLQEKLIMFNKGAKYGQVVFLAGGAGSGKGFAIKNFMQGENFKVRDVDELKKAFQKLSELDKIDIERYFSKLSKKDQELAQKEIIDAGIPPYKLDLRNPTHVYLLHVIVKAARLKEKTLEALLSGAVKGRLPNIIFDVTLKEIGDITSVLPLLDKAGYDSKNIHITWVLTNYKTAINNNSTRDRVVPEDILLKTHEGAAQTMFNLVKKGTPRGVDGAVNVILNNRENTIPFVDPKTGKPYKDRKGEIVVKDFTYLNLKKEGKPFNKEKFVQKQLFDWIKANVPEKALSTSELDNKNE
jgi:dephospho-CoA kinase